MAVVKVRRLYILKVPTIKFLRTKIVKNVKRVKMNAYSPPYGAISAELLISQVKNTAPWIFDNFQTPYTKIVTEAQESPPRNHLEYFKLCMGAHYSSVASFVPTDVDIQIRQKLWSDTVQTHLAMAELVFESLHWDFSPVSNRGISDISKKQWMSGHHGEWFSMAVGAYSALKSTHPESSKKLFEAIKFELDREEKIFLSHLNGDGIALLKATAVIAHNLGDLDRVCDMWNLAETDPLREYAYRLGHPDRKNNINKNFQLVGKIYKAFMAHENHRHFALREPKALRISRDFLIPLPPFFDSWGSTLAKHPQMDSFALKEIIEALFSGMDRLAKAGGPQPQAYPRALAGMAQSFPGGLKRLAEELSAKDRKRLLGGDLFLKLQISKEKFEKDLEQKCHHFVRFAGEA